MRALDLARQDWKERDIAIALGVSKSAVNRWLMSVRRSGREALRSRPRPGAVPKLTPGQLRLIPDFLWHGPEPYGFHGRVWTCERVAGVIHQEFGVIYSKSQVSRLLKRLEWTPQVPITRAIQRDEEAIERWRVQTWPSLKEAARLERRKLVFVDESGFYLLPSVVKTYAPRGQTPILDKWQTRDHLSVMGAVTQKGRMYLFVRQHALNGLHTIQFLAHLLRVAGERLLVIWDGSPIHRRAEVQAYLAEQSGGRIRVEALPPYAPDLNPTEWLWGHLKDVELRNDTCLNLERLHEEMNLAVEHVRKKPALVRSFFEAAGLPL